MPSITLGVSLAKAYQEARCHKRWKANTRQFSRRAEKNCRELAENIGHRTYRISPSLCFIADRPVKREIFAGDFRDRIIHHLVFDKLSPVYERLFINDCYSCRKGRGTGYGIARAAHFLRAVTRNRTRPAWILKLDISGYFMNIDRKRLYEKNRQLIRRFFPGETERMNELFYLLRRIIFNDPTSDCRLRGRREDWHGLPVNKSLFSAAAGRGLPIGNLTSQLFGNVYLNDFDHFVKERLKCRYYGRYVDDLLIFHESRTFLKNLIPKIEDYLYAELGLRLHRRKIYLQPASYGVQFLGAIIKPGRIYAAPRTVSNFREKIRQAATGQLDDSAFFNSYLGLLKKYNTFRLRQKIMTAPETQAALSRLNLKVSQDFSAVTAASPKLGTSRLICTD